MFQGRKRRFHQGPRVTTLNFEAGYMHAVLPKTLDRDLLQTEPSPYMPRNPQYGPHGPSARRVRVC